MRLLTGAMVQEVIRYTTVFPDASHGDLRALDGLYHVFGEVDSAGA